MSSLKYDSVIGQHGTFPSYVLTGSNPHISLLQINGAILYYEATGTQDVYLPTGAEIVEELGMQSGDAVSFTLKNTGTGTAALAIAPGDTTVFFTPGSDTHATVAAGSSTIFTLLCETFDPVEVLVEAFPSGPSGLFDITLFGDTGTATGHQFTISGGNTGMTTSVTDHTVNLGGVLGVPSGGTGAATLSGVLYGNGTAPFIALDPLPVSNGGTGNSSLTGVVMGNGGAAMSAVNVVPVASGGTGAGTLTGVLIGNGTSPVTAVGPLDVPHGGTGNASLTGVLIGNGAGAFTASAPLNVTNGGTGASTLTGVMIGNGTSPVTAVGPLNVTNGGTGASTLTGVMIGNGTSPVTAVGPLNVANGGTGVNTLTGLAVGNGTGAFTGIGVVSDLYFQRSLQVPAAGSIASFTYAPCSPFFQALGPTAFGTPGVDGRIPLTTWQQVQDPTGMSFENTTGQYTLPASGHWFIYASVMFLYTSSVSGYNLEFDIVNDTGSYILSADVTQATGTNGGPTTLRCWDMKNLAAGTVIKCTFYPVLTTTYDLNAGVGNLTSQSSKFGAYRIAP